MTHELEGSCRERKWRERACQVVREQNALCLCVQQLRLGDLECRKRVVERELLAVRIGMSRYHMGGL